MITTVAGIYSFLLWNVFAADEQGIVIDDIDSNGVLTEESIGTSAIGYDSADDLKDGSFNSSGMEYDVSTRTLTLNGYNGTSVEELGGFTAQIYSADDLNIVLTGTNTIKAKSVSGEYADYGIYAEGNINISGTGSLTIMGAETGIFAGKGICFEDAEINDSSVSGLVANWGDVEFKSGKLKVLETIETRNGGNAIIRGGKFEAFKLQANEITIHNGQVNALLDAESKITVNDGTIVAKTIQSRPGISVESGVYIQNGGNVEVKGSPGLSVRQPTTKRGEIGVTVKAGTLKADSETDYAIDTRFGTMSILGGEVTCSTISDSGYRYTGIQASVTVDGGNLSVEASSNGINSALTLKSGKVGIKSGNIGVSSLAVSGGELNIEAEKYGVEGSEDSISILGGECSIYGGTQAIYSRTGEIKCTVPFETGKGKATASRATEYRGETYFHSSESGNISDGPKESYVLINGNRLNGSFETEKYSFDKDKKLLTLRGFDSTSVGKIDELSVVIYSTGDLNIVLTGTNTIKAKSVSGEYADYGIYAEGNINISGTGSLTIMGAETGIFAGKGICFEDAEINDSSVSGLVANWGDVEFKSGKLKVLETIETRNGGNAIIRGGKFEAFKLQANEITIHNGQVNALLDAESKITVNDGTIVAKTIQSRPGISVESGVYIQNGGNVEVKGSPGLSVRQPTTKRGEIGVTVKAGTLKADSETDYAIDTRFGTMSILGGEVTCSTISDSGYRYTGIQASVTVDGGNLSVEASSNGINSALTLKSGKVGIKSGNIGVSSLAVSGGELNIEAEKYGAGASGANQISILGGKCSIYGKTQALLVSKDTSFKTGKNVSLFAGNTISSLKPITEYTGQNYLKAESSGCIDVESIRLNTSSKRILIGDSFTLLATILPEEATDKTITWTTSNDSIASVSTDGVVAGMSKGTATIKAATSNGKTASCTVIVSGGESDIHIVGNQKIDIKSVCFPNETRSISRYTVDNKSIAYVSGSSLVGKKAGKVKVSAQVKNDRQYTTIATCDVEVLSRPKLKFSKPFTIIGQTMDASQCFTTTDTRIDDVTLWESSKSDVVEVIDSRSGTLEAKGNGTARITAYFGNKGEKGTLKVTASVSVKVPAFKNREYKIKTGQKYTLSMKNVTGEMAPSWEIDDPSVATVSSQYNRRGTLTGKAIVEGKVYGNTTLTATIDNVEYSCTISVIAPQINKSNMKIKMGRTGKLYLKNTKIKKTDVIWTSSDPNIATIDAYGTVKGINTGTTTIYTDCGGVRNECIVTVE